MAVNMFLQLDGVKGESQVQNFSGWIQLENFSFDGSQTSSVATNTGSGAGKVTLGPVVVVKQPDSASAPLFSFMCTGKHIAKGTVALVKAGSTQAYLKLNMNEVFICGFKTASSGEIPTETVSMTYKKIVYDYSAQNEQGNLVSTGALGWDLGANKAA